MQSEVHGEANNASVMPQGAQNYEAHNILLNLLSAAHTFIHQKTLIFPALVCVYVQNLEKD